ncbi:hypothetical protein [Halomonas sp. N3-2A]|uniref:hypothetical protein n=1 Tax=Halomonas sp. N3-2A TaxID=2014541 RepID=UPI000B5B1F09|nr:hypothetical protein [Halomonas sp. N3-2A]ASK18380.1 hypothetical protein CEK60_03245 [Halomonas sp. N3-2A]
MAYQFNRFDQAKITDGEWADFEGGRFKIAKSGNTVHLEASERISKELNKKYPDGDVPILERLRATAREWAEGVLRDWEEMEAADGSTVPYSIENATTLLMNDEPLFNEIRRKSRQMARFEQEYVEKEAKKPATSSAGKRSSTAQE